jgi:4-amino-4-deoxy-L-arabinose transferase-like glycosyltransferase
LHDLRTHPAALPFLRTRLNRWVASPAPWVFFLLLGVAIRLRQYFFASSYWYDEAYLILAIRERGFAALLGPQPYNLVIPPFFLWAVRGLYQLGGDGELLMRLPAFLAGIVALVLMIPLARRFLAAPWSVWAFALMAVSPHAVSHGCEVRPYTVDLLVAEWILLCVVTLTESEGRGRRWTYAGLGAAAILGPWTSFPSVFLLGGASAALLVRVWARPTRAGWLAWTTFNAAVAVSGMLLWWVSARGMYYQGMIEHWGHNGWGGFPDWHSPLAVGGWMLYRPYEVANYANRDLGLLLAPLALVGAIGLAFRFRARAVLLAAPFVLAVGAALIGKYPLAHRTTVFLLPCLWLSAAAGLAHLAGWLESQRDKIAVLGALVAVYAAAWTVPEMIRPTTGLEYREAYQFVQSQKEAGDAVFAQMAVVYQTYYGKDADVLKDEDLPKAERMAGERRLWAVFGATRLDIRRSLESAGGRVALEHRVGKLVVLLFAPESATQGAKEPLVVGQR